MCRGVRGSWGKKFQGVEGNIAPRGKKKYYWFLHTTRLDVSLRSNMYLGETKLVFFFLVAPEFFRSNPACTHRLIPWLTRDLRALLNDVESHVSFVLQIILSLINK